MQTSRFMRTSPGQAIVLVALMLVILLAFVGLGIDGANAFAQRRQANVAADSAAMAAARALLDGNLDNSHDHEKNIYDAIDAYLNTHLSSSIGAQNITWDAYYISRNGTPVGAKLRHVDTSIPNVNIFDPDPNSIRGVSVTLNYTFNTYFMAVMGQNSLPAQGFGMAFVGPLGGASGIDVVPLAINRTKASQWANSATGTRWDMDMFGSTVSLSDSSPPSGRPLIGNVDLRQVTLKPGGPTPPLGSADDCDSYSLNSPQDNMSYWWCSGTPHRLVSDTEQATSGMPISGSLKNAVDWRISHSERSTVLFPVYERSIVGTIVGYNIRGFIAIKLTGRSGNRVTGELVKFYSAPGPINGNTNAYFGTYAINMVQ